MDILLEGIKSLNKSADQARRWFNIIMIVGLVLQIVLIFTVSAPISTLTCMVLLIVLICIRQIELKNLRIALSMVESKLSADALRAAKPEAVKRREAALKENGAL